MKKVLLWAVVAVALFAGCAPGGEHEGEAVYVNITAQEAKKIMDTQTGYVILDTRTQEEYDHAVTARNTYNTWLQQNPEATSAEKREKLEELGYQSTYHINNVITRHSYTDKTIPLNACSLGNSLAFYTAPGELWDTVSMEIEEYSQFPMTLCMGYSQDHFNYFVYDPTNGGAMTYESYESNNYRFVAPNTIKEMIAYWKQTLDKLYANLGK